MRAKPEPTAIRFATRADALAVAEMSRDLIETGLGWSWTKERVMRSLRHPDTNAIVAVRAAHRVGFGIMKYGEEEAHLSEGDSFVFDSSAPHSFRNPGRDTARVLWIIGAVQIDRHL